MATISVSAQSKKVTESIAVTGQSTLDLEFDFADDIEFETWDKSEVLVEVEVEINDGKDNDIFTLSAEKSSTTIYVEMDDDMWKKISKDGKWDNCNHRSTINYKVFLPSSLAVRANTISGNYTFEYFGTEMKLNTISGEIDATIPSKGSMDFKAKTISGEVYSDIRIRYPYGTEGLRQIVGQDVRGRIGEGGTESTFETISGNIYLRKG